MAQSFQVFHDTYINTGHDVDGAYGAQCWDGYAFYDRWLGYSPIHCSTTGGARDLWEQRYSNGILNNHDVVNGPLQNGDIGVWGADQGGGYGHVAMYYNGGWMGQNQGGPSYPGGGAVFTVLYNYLPAPKGAFRPKCYSQPAPPPKKKVPKITCVNGLVTNIEWVEIDV